MQLYFSAIALLAGAASAREGDEFFDGSALIAAAHAKVGATTASRYPRVLELDLPYKSSTMQLRLEVNAALFSPDWYAASWDDAGELVIEDNVEDYMCHYLGSVVGMPDSIVALSVCDEMGIQGRIASSDAGLDLGVRATDSSLRSITNVGEHVIYNLTLALEDLYLENEAEFVDDGSNRFEGEMPGPQKDVATDADAAQSRYMNNVVFASSAARLGQFSTNSQERSVTQTTVNIALSYYRDSNSKWSGDPPRHSIRSQVQNPSNWNQSSGGILGKCQDYKRASHSGADSLQCLHVQQQGDPPGVASTGNMCNAGSAACSSAPANGNQERVPYIVAHEMGHQYGFSHESRGVMFENVQYNSLYFESGAVRTWTDRRDNYACLR
jgi:hypothetical protein